jgi:hypothetical protein
MATPAAVAGARSAQQPQALSGSLEGRSLAALSQPQVTTATDVSPEDKKSIHGTMTGASYAAANPAPPPAAAPPAALSGISPPPGLYGGGVGMQLRSSASQYDSSRAQAQQTASSASAATGQGVYGGTGSTNLNQAYAAGSAAAAAPARAASNSTDETVTVTNVAPLVETADAVTVQTKVLPMLPSKFPVLSLVASGRQQLAIDTAGALFRSQDAGVTWQPVPVQWTGRAVKIALVTSPNTHLLANSAGALTAPPAAAKSAPRPLFQLTTADGALWISTDGQSWTRK